MSLREWLSPALRQRRVIIDQLPIGAVLFLAAAEAMLRTSWLEDGNEDLALTAEGLAAWFDDPETDAMFPGTRASETLLLELLPDVARYRQG